MNLENLKNEKIKITIVWKEQNKATQLGKEIEEQGFKFKGKGIYKKGKMTIQTGYDETLEKDFFREIKIG